MAVMEDAVARGKKKQVLRLPFTLFRIAQDDGLWGDAQDDGCFGGR
jgi:hypothetical protein